MQHISLIALLMGPFRKVLDYSHIIEMLNELMRKELDQSFQFVTFFFFFFFFLANKNRTFHRLGGILFQKNEGGSNRSVFLFFFSIRWI